MEFSRPEYWSGQPFPSPGDLPNPGIKPKSPSLQADSLPAYPQGKPKNTGVDSLFLLQWIFLTQESNWGLLHCRQIFFFFLPTELSGNSAGQNTGVSSLSLLQGIFPTQGSNRGLPYCGRILYQLSHKGSPMVPSTIK